MKNSNKREKSTKTFTIIWFNTWNVSLISLSFQLQTVSDHIIASVLHFFSHFVPVANHYLVFACKQQSTLIKSLGDVDDYVKQPTFNNWYGSFEN